MMMRNWKKEQIFMQIRSDQKAKNRKNFLELKYTAIIIEKKRKNNKI